MTPLRLDHIAISATSLSQGMDWTERQLGVALSNGGEHPLMGTHNRLLSLGDLYLEVIAINPDATAPSHPRWFDLDNFKGEPRLTNWIAACNDLDAALRESPPGTGTPLSLTRGDLSWRMAVPANGKLPYDNAFPALIQWQGPHHPALRLPDVGVRLTRLDIIHPQAEMLLTLLTHRLPDPRLHITKGAEKAMRAEFSTPGGTHEILG